DVAIGQLVYERQHTGDGEHETEEQGNEVEPVRFHAVTQTCPAPTRRTSVSVPGSPTPVSSCLSTSQPFSFVPRTSMSPAPTCESMITCSLGGSSTCNSPAPTCAFTV